MGANEQCPGANGVSVRSAPPLLTLEMSGKAGGQEASWEDERRGKKSRICPCSLEKDTRLGRELCLGYIGATKVLTHFVRPSKQGKMNAPMVGAEGLSSTATLHGRGEHNNEKSRWRSVSIVRLPVFASSLPEESGSAGLSATHPRGTTA